ncbi:MAG: PAS domain S-box protein [Candidatus Omnitrophica bacterium]|nr:PAS domain S-box protein [Candidatus Omnitrophota bacterium]MDD5488768.1 PAS domain S-box protein [Candidatus Omnitrophota bacterium]
MNEDKEQLMCRVRELEAKVKQLEDDRREEEHTRNIAIEDVKDRKISEELFSVVFMMSPIPSAITSLLDNRIVKVNDAFLSLTKYPESAVIGKTVDEIDIWVDRTKRQRLIETLRDRKYLKNVEVEIRDSAGVAHECLFSVKIIDLYDKPHVLSMAVDITQHKRAKEELLASEEKYRSFFKECRDAIYITSKSGEFLDFNQTMLEFFGYTRNELLSINVKNLYADDDGRSTFEEDISKNGYVRNYEVTLKRKDGSCLDCLLTSVVRRGKDGSVDGYQGFIRDISDLIKAENGRKQTLEKLRCTIEGTIKAMAMTSEMRDAYTAGHQQRVDKLACAIAEEMALPENDVDAVKMAALIHDIGKIHIPAEILSKPGRVSSIEFNIIKSHAQVGYDILKTVDFPWPIAQIVLQHHERLDGSGYPSGLTAKDIILGAKIIAVADVVEAMSSHRPYRPALGIDVALDEINMNRGVLYASEVVDACVKVFRERNFTFED